jgi:hypothetical protein
MMLSTFNLVPTMTLFLFTAASMPQLALAKQELSSFHSQDKDIKQALQTNPIPADRLHRFQEVVEEEEEEVVVEEEEEVVEEEEEEVVEEFSFSVDLLIIGHVDALTESQKDFLGKKFIQDYNDLSDDMQIVSDVVEEVEQRNEGRYLRRNLRRRSLITRFRGLSFCRRCPTARYRDPLYDAGTKRASIGNQKKRTTIRRVDEDVTNASEDEDLALKFLESFRIDVTNLLGDVTDVQFLV